MKVLLLMTLGVEDKDMSPFFVGHYHANITEDLTFFNWLHAIKNITYQFASPSLQEEEKVDEDEQAGFADDANDDSVASNKILHKCLIDEFLATLLENLSDKDDDKGDGDPGSEGVEDTSNAGDVIDKHTSEEDISFTENNDNPISDPNSNAPMVALQCMLDVAANDVWSITIPEAVRDSMATMDLKKRDKSSTFIAQKTLVGWWFTKMDVRDLIAKQRGLQMAQLRQRY